MNRWQNVPPSRTQSYRALVCLGLIVLAGGMIASAGGIDGQFVSKAAAAEGPVLTPERGGEAIPVPPGMRAVPEGYTIASKIMTLHGGVTFKFGNELADYFRAFPSPAFDVLGATPRIHVFKDAESLYRDGPAALGVDDRFLGAHVNKYTQAALIPSNREPGAKSAPVMVFVQSNMTDPYRHDEAYGAQRRKQIVFATMLHTDELRIPRHQYSTGEIFYTGYLIDLRNAERLSVDNAPGDREMIVRWAYALSSAQQAWAEVGSRLMAPSTDIREQDEFYRVFESSIPWAFYLLTAKVVGCLWLAGSRMDLFFSPCTAGEAGRPTRPGGFCRLTPTCGGQKDIPSCPTAIGTSFIAHPFVVFVVRQRGTCGITYHPQGGGSSFILLLTRTLMH
jgi:hypothetical protein